MKFYDGTKLLSLKDIEGNTPEIYMVTTNRTGGKTTFFGRMVTKRFINDSKKFGLLYRFKTELDNLDEKFFKDIGGLFFKNFTMAACPRSDGQFWSLQLIRPESDPLYTKNGCECGYGIAINTADHVKKNSHLFSDIHSLTFDEFQSETNHYAAREVQKFISIHTSIARGNHQPYRYVPVYMIANPVSLLNPYYIAMGISSRLQENTKFLRGKGFVLEQGFVEGASEAQQTSGFNKAFEGEKYVQYSMQNVYLNDSTTFIEKVTGKNRYLATIKCAEKNYAIREYEESGILYCDDKPDMTYPYKISVDTASHEINYVMLRRNSMFIDNMRYFFDHGCFRFKNMYCKEAVFRLLSY